MEDDKWNLERPPTKWERIYGAAFSILIFVLMSLFLFASSSRLLEEEANRSSWTTFSVAVLLFVGSGYLLFRVVFGKRRKLTSKTITVTGYAIGAMSCLMLVLSVLGLGNAAYLASIGFTGLAGSVVVIRQGKNGKNS